MENSKEDVSIEAQLEAALERVKKLEKTCDELYYSLRMAEDVGIEEDMFEEDERGTGPEGLYLDLEERWKVQNPALAKDEDRSENLAQ